MMEMKRFVLLLRTPDVRRGTRCARRGAEGSSKRCENNAPLWRCCARAMRRCMHVEREPRTHRPRKFWILGILGSFSIKTKKKENGSCCGPLQPLHKIYRLRRGPSTFRRGQPNQGPGRLFSGQRGRERPRGEKEREKERESERGREGKRCVHSPFWCLCHVYRCPTLVCCTRDVSLTLEIGEETAPKSSSPCPPGCS